MKFIDKIRKWPIEKKRTFSIIAAVFLTILIIVLNSGINLLWKDEAKHNNYSDKNNPINQIQESFAKIFNQVKPVLDQAFSSSTQNTPQVINQNNSGTSSFGTTSNIIE
jgi:hypothetical protein